MNRPKVLVCGWIGSTNLGDELIASTFADLISDEGGEPTLVTIDPVRSAAAAPSQVRHRGALDTVGLAREALRHDGLIFGGGGLVQDETGPLNLPFHLTRLAVGRGLRLPWCGLALGVGDVRRRSSRLLVRTVMRGATAITVRDRGSQRRLAELTGSEPQLGIDPVVAMHAHEIDAEDVLAVALRPPNRVGQRRTADAGLDPALIGRWAAAIDSIAAAHGLAVRFVAWDRTHDADVHRAVADRMTTPSTLEEPGPDEIIDRMGSSRLVVSMRYHGAVAARLAGRPAVVLDYSPKMGDLVSEAGDSMVLVDPDAEPSVLADAASTVAPKTPSDISSIPERVDANHNAIQALLEAAGRKRRRAQR